MTIVPYFESFCPHKPSAKLNLHNLDLGIVLRDAMNVSVAFRLTRLTLNCLPLDDYGPFNRLPKSQVST